ncbi:hypothetical protein LX99_04052 [Mucilaginibacter oryzae]|uniref:LysM domain-containing protein n=1 Tax=Mucilaginibacter oryzae TaxID=468058 RepID=A0A316H473_9SPHI|nr:hypothetical protein [Mucilaginibacter oryzae]PWK74250.1 hypothetical protein LX99_04052 [Mucilaginibacter oryzae]
MLKTLSTLIISLFLFTAAKARQQPDSTLKKSPVKTLTDKQYTLLITGEYLFDDINQVALLNHYPMPGDALKFKKELTLIPNQVIKLAAIATELHRKRVEMGNFIVTNETTLDKLLKKGTDNGSIIFYANRSGLYYGELRNAILQACVSTADLLSPGQVTKLETLIIH